MKNLNSSLGSSMSKFKLFLMGLLTVCAVFAFSQISYAADPIIFCKSINENNEAVEPANEFNTTQIAWLTKLSKSCGVPQIIFSIYRKSPTNEELLYRLTHDIRPEWNFFGMTECNFPGDGTYILAFNHVNGELIAEGTVTIKAEVAPEEAEPLPEKIEVEGKSLEEIFNQFKISAQPKK